jgi:glycosyltransferase involved in cell wall biosynthesis
MPPGLYPRSIQVARLMKGLKRLGWHGDIITPRAEDRAPDEPLDPDLAARYADAYGVVPVDLSRVDPEFGPRWRRWRERFTGEAALSGDQLWMARAVAVGQDRIRRHRVDALVTFAQPWSDHRVGLALADWHPRLPWIAHFSDPWTDSLYDAGQPDDVRAAERRTEHDVVKRAEAVVFTNHYALDLVMAKYPASWRSKAFVVPHTTDPELLEASVIAGPPPSQGRPLRLAHVGNLFVGRRRAHALFEAMALLHRRRPLTGRLELVLLGAGSGLYEAREKVFELSLEPIVTFHPRVSHVESLEAMAATDVLVLIDAPAATNVFMPSKVVDYLMAQRPILAMTPAVGSTADIMRALGYPICDSENIERIAAALEDLMQRYERGALTPAAPGGDYLKQFSLDETANRFAAVLEHAITGAPAPRSTP